LQQGNIGPCKEFAIYKEMAREKKVKEIARISVTYTSYKSKTT
jgi:hypothetical protein